jgi:hypothetical protein
MQFLRLLKHQQPQPPELGPELEEELRRQDDQVARTRPAGSVGYIWPI